MIIIFSSSFISIYDYDSFSSCRLYIFTTNFLLMIMIEINYMLIFWMYVNAMYWSYCSSFHRKNHGLFKEIEGSLLCIWLAIFLNPLNLLILSINCFGFGFILTFFYGVGFVWIRVNIKLGKLFIINQIMLDSLQINSHLLFIFK